MPGAIVRAYHEAVTGRGPAIVVVPMDDWDEELDEEVLAAPVRLEAAAGIAPSQLDELVGLLEGVRSCALVAGAGAADESTWAAVVALAERLACPVFQEAFGSRPGFPQDHPLFAGHLSFARDRLRAQLAPYELVVAVGAPVLRLYPFVPGPLAPAGTRLVLVTDDPAEAHHSAVELALVGPLAPLCAGLAERLKSAGRARGGTATRWAPVPPPPPGPGEVLRAGHVFAALAERLPADVVLVEESPSSRPQLHELLPARTPLGFVSAAMGGLGFGLPAAVGLRMAVGDRPVVALLGDGASLYAVQALWSAARYRTGVLFVVLANGGYAVMDRLVEQAGRKPSWPGFPEVRPAVLAEGFSCPARAVGDYAGLVAVLDEVVPGLAERDEPLLVEVAVEPDPVFAP